MHRVPTERSLLDRPTRWLRNGGVILALTATATQAHAQNPQSWAHALTFAGQQMQATAAKIPTTSGPEATGPDGSWSLIPDASLPAWTQGFFPGSLWYLYEQSGDATFKDLATRWTAPLEVQKTNTTTHDLGFKMFPSFGHGYELTNNAAWHQILLTSAASLATRYRANPGIICMGDWNPNWKMPIVIDTMMDIELLMWAARNGGDPSWENMAIAHAEATLKYLVRPDGSTFHVADFDPTTGQLRWQGTFQGYSDSSTWTRGQVWAMYGFARMYRYTHRPEFLDGARRTTELFLSRLPSDSIPPWDFDAPNPLKDSSAAAAAAAALQELADVETDQTAAARYRSVAETILDTLSSPAYLAEGTNSEGVLLHGVGNYPANQEVDVSLSYGDYYFIEAILRAQAHLQGTSLLTISGQAAGATTSSTGTSSSSGSASSGTGGTTSTGSTGNSTATSSTTPTTPGTSSAAPQTGCDSLGLGGARGLWVWGMLAGFLFLRRSWRRRSTVAQR